MTTAERERLREAERARATRLRAEGVLEKLWRLRVLCLAPGLTRTEFFDTLGGGNYRGSYQTPEQVVRTAMRALDRDRRPSVASGRLNALTATLPRLFTRRRTVIIGGAISARAGAAPVTGRDSSASPGALDR